ncbi:hypothetical protein CH063_03503 [Colletotrichum higginsianum]|uniref:Uncharacterized protein n=1 Tax=Colletotrichum higginsianum (strain IMI 349063) TaxID=759273 RepID=H1VXX3_COLHI|nr:hypothetical protein CH063_03503 [Colletotrichum higginsianum]
MVNDFQLQMRQTRRERVVDEADSKSMPHIRRRSAAIHQPAGGLPRALDRIGRFGQPLRRGQDKCWYAELMMRYKDGEIWGWAGQRMAH